MITCIRGIIINETPYGDSSKIINIATKDYGIVGIMCKGAKSMKSKLRALTTRFTYGDFHMYYNESKLSTLITVDIVNNLNNLKSDITLLSYLTYITDLVHQVMKQNNEEEVFDKYIDTVLKMEEGIEPSILTNILEIKLLDYLGVGLNLDSCVKCGNKESIVTINADYGGYLCSKCIDHEQIVSPKTIKLLRMYYYVEINSITKIDISENVAREINFFLDKYYERYTGLYLYSKKFLEEVR